jgi:hypothetical protein
VSALTAREILLRVYGDSKNFMTPHIMEYGKISPELAWELSFGDGVFHGIIWGVTFAAIHPHTDGAGLRYRKFNYMCRGGFLCRSDALAYIEHVKAIYRAVRS